jgi:hypothetical protein
VRSDRLFERKMTKADQLTTLLSFLLLAYLALTAAGAFAFTFMTRGALPLYRQAAGVFRKRPLRQ